MKSEIIIEPEDFRLIKKFYHEFTRKPNLQSNNYTIGWSDLMPVVEKIDSMWEVKLPPDKPHPSEHVVTMPISSHIQQVYKEVIRFIKWYNSVISPTGK